MSQGFIGPRAWILHNHDVKTAHSLKSLRALAIASLMGASLASLNAQADPAFYSDLRWRHIGPFRGGRTVGAAGVPQQPNIFYIGVNNGGGWKKTHFRETWGPHFHEKPTQSICAL